MDELRRLYEHQTMMAFGIYSFLDNLLTQIPSRSRASSAADTNLESITGGPQRVTGLPYFRANELSESLLELNRPESFQDRRERLRMLPRLSALSAEGVNDFERPVAINETIANATRDSEVDTNAENLAPLKCDVIPGGYPEEIFIYLSEREKEDYICSICYCVLKDAYQCKNEHHFCYGCIYTWSTGSSVGHDGCPVCRCDGLYAKNFDLIEKIEKKRAKCVEPGCNWMGFLVDYHTHTHRKYTPRELDILITRNQTQVQSEQRTEVVQTQSTQQRESGVLDFLEELTVGENPELENTTVHSNDYTPSSVVVDQPVIQNTVEPQQVQHIRRSSHQTPIERPPTRRSTSRSNTPTRNRMPSRTRASSRQSIHSTSGRAVVHTRPPLHTRLSRTISGQTIEQSNGTRRIGRIRARSRQGSSTGDAPLLMAAPEHRVMAECSGVDTSVRPLEASGESRLLPLRATCESETFVQSTSVPVDGTQLSLFAEALHTPGRNTPLSRCSIQECVEQASDENELHSNTNDDFAGRHLSLPTIDHNTALTTRRAMRSYCETEGIPNERIQENDLARIHPTCSTQSNRTLEFRRLVPRRNRRVTEQLRETREQLAAMLRLMTLELEERRQQVLAAALATVNRRRLLRSVTDRLPSHNTDDEDGEEDNMNDSPRFYEGQNNNIYDCRNTLYTLPGREGLTIRSSRCHTLQNLTNRIINERIQDEMRHSDYFPPRNETRLSASSSTESMATEELSSSDSIPRLLSRIRLRSMEQRQNLPTSVVVVTGRRSLGRLLAELQCPRAEFHRWSSDEDDDDDDDTEQD